jgi:hypothetical protein
MIETLMPFSSKDFSITLHPYYSPGVFKFGMRVDVDYFAKSAGRYYASRQKELHVSRLYLTREVSFE